MSEENKCVLCLTPDDYLGVCNVLDGLLGIHCFDCCYDKHNPQWSGVD